MNLLETWLCEKMQSIRPGQGIVLQVSDFAKFGLRMEPTTVTQLREFALRHGWAISEGKAKELGEICLVRKNGAFFSWPAKVD